MFNRTAIFSVFSVALLASFYIANAGEDDKREIKLEGIECLFCKKQVTEESSVDYKGGRIFFGCPGCSQAFERDVKKFATKANAQLVATQQARQKACPLSGNPCKADFTLTVAKAKIAFCCPNCKDAVAKLKGDAQLEKVFSDKAFKKAFAVPKPAQSKEG